MRIWLEVNPEGLPDTLPNPKGKRKKGGEKHKNNTTTKLKRIS
jgi:hypothetical protein